MKSILKTLILAAAGAALIAVSPVSAQTNKRTAVRNTAPVQTILPRPDGEAWQYGEINASPRVDQFGQIRDEYLKDAPTHNGNSY